jgi:glucans biosynthesis protein
MHGGKGSGAPKGNRNAWKHGAKAASTRETLALIRALGEMLDDDTAGRAC